MNLCIHGIGYIGLATAALFANAGHEVAGYDVDDRTIARLRARDLRTTEADLRAFVVDALDAGFTPVDDPVPADVHVVCVPTPFDRATGRADLRYVERAGETVGRLLRPGDLVVLESTVPPGTTERVLGPVLSAASGLEPGEFLLAHCPETVLPGNIVHELVRNERIVGGVDDASTDAVLALYEPVVRGRIHRAPDAATAEFVKLAQNAYRDVNVAFANELARVAADYGIDGRTAIDLANVHPRVGILQPGPGVGGHCIPVDPLFLGHGSESLDVMAAARRVNDGMPGYVADLLTAGLGSLAGRTVAVLGVAYKGNVDDARNSPGLQLVAALRDRGRDGDDAPGTVRDRDPLARRPATDGGDAVDATDPRPIVRATDPYVTDAPPTAGVDVVDIETALADADAAAIVTDHDDYRRLDPATVAGLMAGRLIVDARGVLDPVEWAAAGFDVRRV
jgi:UDP-N-acetyl-D-mannosaminuronic acid dehydrogenase